MDFSENIAIKTKSEVPEAHHGFFPEKYCENFYKNKFGEYL